MFIENKFYHVLNRDCNFFKQSYTGRFENNLIELKEVYEKCLNNFEVALALYPENVKLAELKEKYNYFFKLFDDSSPISKVLCVGVGDNKTMPTSGDVTDEDFIPNYSLCLSHMTPKNLRTDLDGIGNSPKKLQFGGMGSPVKGQEMVEIRYKNVVQKHNAGEKANKIAGMVRPRRGIKASCYYRSPYVSRVVDVSAHQITTEERNVWDWLFQTRKNIK